MTGNRCILVVTNGGKLLSSVLVTGTTLLQGPSSRLQVAAPISEGELFFCSSLENRYIVDGALFGAVFGGGDSQVVLLWP
jgi:hypothetical protein